MESRNPLLSKPELCVSRGDEQISNRPTLAYIISQSLYSKLGCLLPWLLDRGNHAFSPKPLAGAEMKGRVSAARRLYCIYDAVSGVRMNASLRRIKWLANAMSG
jgi:hypothetical protein